MLNREQRMMEICGENERLQYDGDDERRIAGLAATFTNVAMMMIEALGKFNDTAKLPVDENSADLMKEARGDAVLGWGALQVATSKIAGVLRIDGDEAFNRILAIAQTDEEPDVAGL